MKTLIITLTATLTAFTLLAACNANKIGEIAVKAKTLNQRVTDAGCWDVDGSIEGSDYCLSVAFPHVDGDFMRGAE